MGVWQYLISPRVTSKFLLAKERHNHEKVVEVDTIYEETVAICRGRETHIREIINGECGAWSGI